MTLVNVQGRSKEGWGSFFIFSESDKLQAPMRCHRMASLETLVVTNNRSIYTDPALSDHVNWV